ncbi:MauE/DoxX family redox-associated membrane protein [Anatilimnocola sp. NA78]|uniref:DoxX family protein n=1 Tax=Anatilimnocola sp. NA78 TaxID=3415683 RepID=UPI003CE56125
MNGIKSVSRYLLAALMLGAGTMHFVQPQFFVRIMPPYLPWHWELVYLSGAIEFMLGLLLLVPRFSRFAAWGIIALLVAVFPANIYAYQHQELIPASPLLHFLRLPLQAIFVIWAFWHTMPTGGSHASADEVRP